MRILVAGMVLVLSGVFLMGTNAGAAGKDDPKYKIKEVMKIAMKGGLCGKVASGKASDDEKKQLIELFTALAANKPPMGDADAWKTRTTALLEAAKKGDGDALKKAANCMSCHKEFKK